MFAAHVMIERCHSTGKRPTRIDEGTLHTKCKTHHNICGGAFGDFCVRSLGIPMAPSRIGKESKPSAHPRRFHENSQPTHQNSQSVKGTISPPMVFAAKVSAHPSKKISLEPTDKKKISPVGRRRSDVSDRKILTSSDPHKRLHKPCLRSSSPARIPKSASTEMKSRCR